MNYLCETFKSKDIAPPMIKYDKILIPLSLNTIYGIWLKFPFLSYFIAVFIWKISQRYLVKAASHVAFICLAEGEDFHKKEMWHSGRALECKSDGVGSRPGGVSLEIFNICWRSSTFVKVCRKSSIFLIILSSEVPESFSNTRLNLVLRHHMRVSNYFVKFFYSLSVGFGKIP